MRLSTWRSLGGHFTSRGNHRCLKVGGSFVGRLQGLNRGCVNSTGHIVVALQTAGVIRDRGVSYSCSPSDHVVLVEIQNCRVCWRVSVSIFVTLGGNVIAIIQQKAFCAGHGLVRVTAIHTACYRARLNSHVVSCTEGVGASVAVRVDWRKTVLVASANVAFISSLVPYCVTVFVAASYIVPVSGCTKRLTSGVGCSIALTCVAIACMTLGTIAAVVALPVARRREVHCQ